MKMDRIVNRRDLEREPPAQKVVGAEMGVWGAPKELQFSWTFIRAWETGLEVGWGKFAEYLE